MSAVQLTFDGWSDAQTGTARLTVSDPNGEVSRVDFYTTTITNADGTGNRTGPAPADRTPSPGTYEKDAGLDPDYLTRVEAVVTLAAGGTLAPTPAAIGFGRRTTDPAAIRGLVATCEYGKFTVAVVPGSAYSWKCWMRPATWPTVDASPAAATMDEYLRFEAKRDRVTFSMPGAGSAGTIWYVVAIGFDADGNPGPRLTSSLALTYAKAARPSLATEVRQLDGVEHWKIEAEETLKEFTNWLEKYQQVGYIGEVGWPWNDVTSWNEVARRWFTLANESRLWVTAWAVGEWWGSYQLQPYALENSVWVEKPQAAVLEEPANLTGANYKRGVNVAGAEFGTPTTQPTSTFSNVNRGVHGTDYIWNGAATYEYLYSQGQRLVRIPFRWERVQPTLGAALDPTEMDRMRTSVNAATTAGLEVILDVHNYGGYYLHDVAANAGVRRTIGTAEVSFDHFADFWARLAAEFNSNAAVIGYGLMNEPVEMVAATGLTEAETWAAAAQRAADAIRGAALPAGAEPKWIIVAGYEWSGTWSFDAHHPGPFVTDAENKVMYEAHQYFDANRSGSYAAPDLEPVQEENWVRWTPNVKAWEENSAGDGALSVELYRAGSFRPVGAEPLWRKGIADTPVSPCISGDPSCGHRTYEYRVVLHDARDGSISEFAASISGPYVE